jgi:aconitate hydratase
MCPEYGATCAIFPPDDETLRYLRFTGRSDEQIQLVEAYMTAQGMLQSPSSPEVQYSEMIELDLTTVKGCVAGPRRPQDRVELHQLKQCFQVELPKLIPQGRQPADFNGNARGGADGGVIEDGSLVIAAITSCTNTSNPSVTIAAGLLAKKAVARGLRRKPWVKTSLAPGSRVVSQYFDRSGLTSSLEQLGFHLVGYGCTTCIGNSGPLSDDISMQIHERQLVVASALSGNRNFEGRINPDVRANFLMSPPLGGGFRFSWSYRLGS